MLGIAWCVLLTSLLCNNCLTLFQIGDGSTLAAHLPSLVSNLQGHFISRVACGSAHTVAWTLTSSDSEKKTKKKSKTVLPTEIPIEFNLLQSFTVETLRNRLILLNQFSGDLLLHIIR